MRKFLTSVLLVLLVAASTVASSARAQSGGHAEISGLDVTSFPTMTASLDIFDAGGEFISDLSTDAVTILEEGLPLPLDSIQELQLGVQFVVAINPGPTFATRDANAISRYDKISQVLVGWASGLPSTSMDDLSLVTTGGPDAIHLQSGQELVSGIAAYQPPLRTSTPSLDTLARALDAAADATSQPGTKRVVLFITPPTDWEMLAALENLTARAAEMKVRVFVWMITSQAYFTTRGAEALQDLATQTGGWFLAYSGEETIPNPENYLIPLRHTYMLTYTSHLTTSGSHIVAAQTILNDQAVTTPTLTFNLDVQPPNPILVSPPQQIVRQSPDNNIFDTENLAPLQQEIEILVEFPDGHTRPLTRTTLYIDGQVTAENTQEPFSTFVWDLSGYASSGVHSLSVEAEDSLGLSKMSISTTVTVTVIQPPRGLKAILSRYSLWLAGGTVVIAGGILIFILFSAGKWRLPSTAALRRRRKMYLDPLTQPVIPKPEKSTPRLPWTRSSKTAPAYLVRVKGDNQPATTPPIPLADKVISIGTDPIQATQVLDDPSISPLHAQIRQVEDGSFYLHDEHSVAGTWVNYEPLKDTPRRLKHGDIINIGQVTFRFMLRQPPEQTTSPSKEEQSDQ